MGLPAGSEIVRPENQEDRGGAEGAHDPMQDDAVDDEELMVPRVPNVPPEPSARQIAEHVFVQKLVSPLRCVDGSNARTLFPRRRRVARNCHRLWLLSS